MTQKRRESSDVDELDTLRQQRAALRSGLRELLEVAERIRGGDRTLDAEEWYATRDYARKLLGEIE